MAFASSVVSKAQMPVACDLCETVDNVDWYCTDCAETLCVTCQVSHARSKASRDHVIIPRSNALRYMTENTNKDGIFCETHGGGKFELHCDDCDVMVCRKCVTGDHKGHIFTDIQEVAEIKKETFNNKVESIINNAIPEINAKLLNISYRKEALLKHNIELKKQLRTQRDDIITAINESFGTLDKQINENTENNAKTLGSDEENLRKTKDALLLKTNDWKNRVPNSSPQAVLQYLKTVDGTFDQINTSPGFESTVKTMIYTPGEFNKDYLRKMLGAVSSSVVQSKPKSPKIIFTLGCDFGVEHIVAVGPWLAYASNTAQTHLALVDAEKMNSKGIIKLDFLVGAFDVSLEREIYIRVSDEKCVKKYGKDLSTSVFVSTAPCSPRGICVTESGDVLIGTRSTSPSSQLLRFSDQGTLKEKVEGYFKSPDYICENKNGDLCVSDSVIAQVLVFNAKLEKRFNYNGHPKREKSFAPRGIACNAQGYIFICDCVNDQVEVIDANGKFIQMFLTKENGVNDPWDLSIDKAGRLWIGQRGRDDTDKEQTKVRIMIAEYEE